MKFMDAVNECKVRGYIARPNSEKYWKNHSIPLTHRVIWWEQKENDWEIFDPESEETSIIG